MPKMKTKSSAAKRFKLTGTGKIRRHRAYHSHLLTKKSTGQKRRLRKGTLLSKADEKRVRRMIPNAK